MTSEIPKWEEPDPRILNRQMLMEALVDYILQVNYDGYKPDPRKVLAVRASDRTTSLRNAATPVRQEVYYFIEGEVFPKTGTTRLRDGQKPIELAEALLDQLYEKLYIWIPYDFTKSSTPGFRKPFENKLIVKGSAHPNPERVTRRKDVPAGIHPQFFLPDPVPRNQGAEDFYPDLPIDEVVSYLNNTVTSDFRNALPEGDNHPIWDLPLVGVAAADDPLFERFQDSEVIGPQHRLPVEWLQNAQSIVSVFLPFSKHIFRSYKKDSRYSAIEFSSGKWNGSKFLNVIRRGLVDFFERMGGEANAPNIDPRYGSDSWLPSWSERHAAFAAGLGTFGLQQGFITARGVYGRLCSVITTLRLTPTIRPYTEVYGYCLYAFDGSCRACVERCPTGAVKETGKVIDLCLKSGNGEHFKAWGYGACGHCSTFTPCSREIPAKIRKRL